jgi:hypothetical protein
MNFASKSWLSARSSHVHLAHHTSLFHSFVAFQPGITQCAQGIFDQYVRSFFFFFLSTFWFTLYMMSHILTNFCCYSFSCLSSCLSSPWVTLKSTTYIIVWWVQEIKVKRTTQHIQQHNTTHFLPLPPKEQYQHEIGCVTATPFRPNFPLRDNLRDRNYSIAQIIAQGKVRPQLVCLNFCLMRDRATSL